MLNARSSRLSGLRQIMATLALVAACMSGLVPSGWMPQAGADGQFTLVICTGEGMRELVLDAGGNAVSTDSADPITPEAPCAFAGLAAIALMPDSPAWQHHALPLHRLYAPGAAMPASGHIALPGQRGPPLSSLTDLQTA
ncbi:hypothetical protein [Glycocaulis sp.]|uniref:hypothetical protein n=1 Tax=Glycocaulis sp. TaxID=1969725 RepID=UPI003D1A545F